MSIEMNVFWILLCLICMSYLFLIGLFTYGWFGKNTTGTTGSKGARYAVSVIIAAKNEEKYITGLLNDLLEQDYQKDLMEIIIVDDHSTDRTSQIVNDFIKGHGTSQIVILKNEDYGGSGKKAALAAGIAHSTGKVIMTTDADCHFSPGWISALLLHFQNERCMMVFGPVSYFPCKKLSDQFQALEFAGLVASGAGAAMAGHPFMCNGANLAYRKDAFFRVDGFAGNEKFISGDDVFLMHKIKKSFGRTSIVFCKDREALVKTLPAGGILQFISQRVRWASKSTGYRDFLAKITAIIVFSYSFAVLFSLIGGLLNIKLLPIFCGLFVLKMITDLPLMLGLTGFTGQRRLMRWYLPLQLVYAFYIVTAGVLSRFGRRKW
jgi:cellulose synthase/poly-beta-1,6-N-acetylglucosamine synthase-like glycosyltransferase